MPKGNLGRIGVAISRSNPNTIYALVEAKKNALYKSTDGGFNFNLLSDNLTFTGTSTPTLTINATPLSLDGNLYHVILSSPAFACVGDITSADAFAAFAALACAAVASGMFFS